MLVVKRAAGQSVQIGPDITVTIVKVNRDGTVRLAIDAPRDVQIGARTTATGE